jgi:5'-3' exonuclease
LSVSATGSETSTDKSSRKSRLMLLDAPSLYFRAFHGVPASVTSPGGMPVNAIRGFLEIVARQIRDHRPDLLVATFDADWRPAFRVQAIPAYKLHRVAEDGGDGAPDELAAQVPVIEEVLDALGIVRLGVPGFEADDVIGTLTEQHDGPVDVVTGDRDLFQLVRDDQPVRVLYSVEKYVPIDEAAVRRKFDIPGRAYGEYAVLRGDPSDGLPGVPGVGSKTAAALITSYGTVEAMLAALDEGRTDGFPAGARNKLAAARDYLATAPRVVHVIRDVPLPRTPSPSLDRLPADAQRLVQLSEEYGLDGPLNRLLAAVRS